VGGGRPTAGPAAVLDGALRAANAPTPADVAVLDAHAWAIPVGGQGPDRGSLPAASDRSARRPRVDPGRDPSRPV